VCVLVVVVFFFTRNLEAFGLDARKEPRVAAMLRRVALVREHAPLTGEKERIRKKDKETRKQGTEKKQSRVASLMPEAKKKEKKKIPQKQESKWKTRQHRVVSFMPEE
jgi:hypothetical protein